MSLHRARALQAALLTLTLCAGAILAFPSSALPAAQRPGRAVDALFADFDDDVPGAAVIVVRDGEVVYKAAYGLADLRKKRPVTTDTAFHLASTSKQMTALAVLLLVEEGKLDLDEPVARHLPELRGWAGEVTPRHLLQHTSGIPDVYDALEEKEGMSTNADALKVLARWKRLDFRPGTRHEYSNTGFDLLAPLIEKVSGQPFSRFMEERIFRPAGMTNTFAFDETRRRQSRRALGYALAEDGESWELDDDSSLNGIHGSGSIYSTVEDLARYDKALFSGKLLPPETRDLLFQPGRLRNGEKLEYGLGWEVYKDEYNHSGLWMGFSSDYLRRPKQKLSVIVLSNSSETDAESLAREVAEIFAE